MPRLADTCTEFAVFINERQTEHRDSVNIDEVNRTAALTVRGQPTGKLDYLMCHAIETGKVVHVFHKSSGGLSCIMYVGKCSTTSVQQYRTAAVGDVCPVSEMSLFNLIIDQNNFRNVVCTHPDLGPKHAAFWHLGLKMTEVFPSNIMSSFYGWTSSSDIVRRTCNICVRYLHLSCHIT